MDEDLDDEVFLPSLEEREFIFEQLRLLVKRFGPDPILRAPLLEPSDTYFPDRWAGGAASLRRLIRRCLTYAALDDVRVEVKVHPDDDVGGPVAPAGIGAVIWFVRRDGDTAHFAARQSGLKDPQVIVPAAARMAAQVFRLWHGITKSDETREHQLIDLTAIYLGFGVLTLNASIRHGVERQGGFRLSRTKTRLGVLKPQLLGFALAIVASARQLDAKGRRVLRRKLDANPAGFYESALDVLDRREPTPGEELRLPEPKDWPEPWDLDELTAPLDDQGDPDESQATEIKQVTENEDKGVVGMNDGKPIFRVERSKATRLAKMLALPTALGGVLLNRIQLGIEIEMWQAGVLAGVLGLIGLAVGRLLPDVRCSEPKCGEPLTKEMKTCPRCGGTVSGVIGHPKERLAAEDKLSRSEGETAPDL